MTFWATKKKPRRSRDGGTAGSHLVSTDDLPKYDRKQNPWESLGLDERDLGSDRDSPAAREICEAFGNLEPITYPPDLLHITLEDADDWR